MKPEPKSIENVVREMHAEFFGDPESLELDWLVRRCAEHVRFVRECFDTTDVRVCDIGGQFGEVASGCAAIGMQAMFIDDFRDECFSDPSDRRFELHKKYGAERIDRDVISEGIDFSDASVDAFTCFASMEHWPHSPKRLFAQVSRALKPGGAFILSGPNCVDLMKRLTVPLGRGSWSTMDSWYESPVFRSHVREPSVADLRYIAQDMGLVDVTIEGRNWPVHVIRNRALRGLAVGVDRMLRLRPGLCSEIYLIARKPAADARS